MTTLTDLLVVVHLLGMAALVGGYLVAATQQATPNTVMVWGARIQLLSGAALMGVEMSSGAADGVEGWQMWVGIKLLVALVVTGCTEVAAARSRRGEPLPALAHAAGGLALVNVLIGALAL